MKQKNLHSGHRKRLKERFINEGLDKFDNHQILELLLFFSIPRKDTNELAHILLDTFGSISGVLDAPVELLQKISGISSSTITLLKLIPEISRLYLTDKHTDQSTPILSTEDAGKIILNKFIGRQNEVVILMLMDAKRKMLFCDVISQGSVNAAQVYIRDIVSISIKYNSSWAIIAHNHPSGIALPSRADIETTYRVKEALKTVNVRLEDHIIVADGDYVSLAQEDSIEGLFN